MRASWALKLQLMVERAALRRVSQAVMARFRASASRFLPLRQAQLKTLNSISAIPSASSGQD